MKKILILTLIVMITGAAAAQEAETRSGNADYAGLRYCERGWRHVISDFELTYEHLFPSRLGIGASFRADIYAQILSLTCSYHYTFWKGLGVVGGVGVGCTHYTNGIFFGEGAPQYVNTVGVGLRLELGAEYDFEKIPLRLSANLSGSRGWYNTWLIIVPTFGAAYRF